MDDRVLTSLLRMMRYKKQVGAIIREGGTHATHFKYTYIMTLDKRQESRFNVTFLILWQNVFLLDVLNFLKL